MNKIENLNRGDNSRYVFVILSLKYGFIGTDN